MRKGILRLAAILSLAACAGPKDNASDNPSWAGKMQKTAKSFQDLVPYLYNTDKFTDKKNSKTIEGKIAKFKSSIHKIDGKQAEKLLGDDPYVLESLNNLQELTDRAYDSFKRGDRKNSQILLKATTNTCFKCHTRQNLGPQHLNWAKFDVSKVETNAVEKAHILVSMRQYEEAKKYLKEFLSSSEDEGKFDIVYENALHYYMMISLRGQNTFKDTIDFINAKVLVVKAPTTLHFTMKHWLKDLVYWNKNKKLLKPTLPAAHAVLKRNKNPYNERNLVNNLIASALLHEYLMGEKDKQKKAQAYSMLGHAYDELVLEGFWDLPEVYYEMCIDYWPKSTLAKNCYRKLKDNITIGYSGSRGTMVPSQEYQRLEDLRKKAGL